MKNPIRPQTELVRCICISHYNTHPVRQLETFVRKNLQVWVYFDITTNSIMLSPTFFKLTLICKFKCAFNLKKSYRGLTHRFMAPRNGILYLRNSKFTNHQRQRIRDGIHDNSNSLKCKYRWLLLISRYDKLIGPQGFVFAVVALDAAAYAWTIHLSSENVMLVCCLMIFYWTFIWLRSP